MGYLGEFIGTFVLMIFGAGVGASVNLEGAYAKASAKAGWIMIALGWGLAVMLGVYTAAYFGAPGHLNPAVTIAFAAGGIISWKIVPGYILAQIVGAFLGASVVALHFYPHFKKTKSDQGNTVAIFATVPAIDNKLFNFISEVVATFAFILCLLTLGNFAEGLKPLVVGLLIVAIGFSLGSTTGYAINPARDFGPRLAYAVLPIPNKGSANWDYSWVPILGPIIGGLLAVFLVKIV
ncbi:glycerol uptake facilitator [Liquorilactobacillus ghanensis DSM 18630]|uniref:Glycerol uptake facilitator n=1 Tax=Liquorilactobacillus ghanensis DSM 18630 TaxID=1423750 RepID=A0A0R1VR13_9LACO|nr:MIP/aquaporin family protein [Liquorilactobacillus ghanensis]KRM06315.1 glycerol uptake facilitator [Liquorilactobacillus ghanensis DSM 18630]